MLRPKDGANMSNWIREGNLAFSDAANLQSKQLANQITLDAMANAKRQREEQSGLYGAIAKSQRPFAQQSQTTQQMPAEEGQDASLPYSEGGPSVPKSFGGAGVPQRLLQSESQLLRENIDRAKSQISIGESRGDQTGYDYATGIRKGMALDVAKLGAADKNEQDMQLKAAQDRSDKFSALYKNGALSQVDVNDFMGSLPDEVKDGLIQKKIYPNTTLQGFNLNDKSTWQWDATNPALVSHIDLQTRQALSRKETLAAEAPLQEQRTT